MHNDVATPKRLAVPAQDVRWRVEMDDGNDGETTTGCGAHVHHASRPPTTTRTPSHATCVLRHDGRLDKHGTTTCTLRETCDVDGHTEDDGETFARTKSVPAFSRKKTLEKVRVRYLSGDEITLHECATVMDVKIQIAAKHNKFVPHITVLASPRCLYAEDARALNVQDESKFAVPDHIRAPHELAVVLGNLDAESEESFWRDALIAHARSGDEAGVHRAMHWLAQSTDFDAANVAGFAAFDIIESAVESTDVPALFQRWPGSADAASIFRTLLCCRANPNYICGGRGDTRDGRTLLVHAVDKQQVAFVEALLALNSERNTKNEDDATMAADSTKDSMVCDVNLPSVTNPCFTPLHMAVRNNVLPLARMLLQCAADVEARAAQGSTPLILACFACVSPDETIDEIISLLLQHNADIHAENESKWTPLHIAAHNNKASLVRLLVQMNADVRTADLDGWTPAHWAAKEGHVGALAELLSRPQDKDNDGLVNSVDRNGATMLHWAAHQDHESCVAYLLQMKGNVNAVDNTNRTPLYCAGKRDASSKLLESLLERHADPNIASAPAMVTPLHAVAHSGSNHGEPNARVLLDFCANIYAADTAGFTALHYATRKGHLKVMELILRAADSGGRKSKDDVKKLVNAQTAVQKQTALHLAVAAEQPMLQEATLLLHARADVGAMQNSDGRTVMQVANDRGDEDMIALLSNPRRYRSWLCGGM